MAKAKSQGADEDVCFVISPIGDDESDERKRADDVFDYIIEPAAKEHGLNAIRADKIDESGSITGQVVSHLVTARIVVADFWGHNPNVFYEVAIRHAIKKPVIHLYLQKIPFDVLPMRAIKLDHTDLKSVFQAMDAVKNQMKNALEVGFEQWTPIGYKLGVEEVKVSGTDLEKRLAETVQTLEKMSNQLQAQIERPIPRRSLFVSSFDERLRTIAADQVHLPDRLTIPANTADVLKEDLLTFLKSEPEAEEPDKDDDDRDA